MRKMLNHLLFVMVLLPTLTRVTSAQPRATQNADWTVMVYMNAKNNLECAGIANFQQMATIGSSTKVNLIVELGRPAKHRYTPDEGGWTGVLRFRVTQGMHPIESSALNPDDPDLRASDMGSGKTLSDFVRWAEKSYPANKYVLVIWNHGQGWRFYQTIANENMSHLRSVSYVVDSRLSDDEPQPCNGPSGKTLTGGVKSVSFDEDTGNYLNNRDAANSLQDLHLDVLGFDACLMAMIESAYAFRRVAPIMVASEELVPGDGWNYNLWLNDLIKKPETNPIELARDIVQSYKQTYGDSGDTTLSAIDLSKIEDSTKALAKLSLLVNANLRTEGPLIAFTRASFRTFGDWYSDSWQDCQGSKVARFLGIDLIQFLNLYKSTTRNPKIQQEIVKTVSKLKLLFIANYASSLSAGADHWASGIAIYFPSSELDYQCDADKSGYDLEAVRAGVVTFPPEFVEMEGWPDLLRSYLQSRRSPKPWPDFRVSNSSSHIRENGLTAAVSRSNF